MGEVFFIASGKGGTGKSSVSSCLGTALAQQNHRTILVDMDFGLRSLDIMLGVQDTVLYNLYDVLDGRCTLADAVLPAAFSQNLFLLSACQSADLTVDVRKLEALIETLKNEYDFVLLDGGAGLGYSFRVAAKCAHRALLVVTPDPICVRDVTRAAQLLTEEGFDWQRLIINKVSPGIFKKNVLTSLDEVIDKTGVQLIGVVPNDPTIMHCTSKGMPLTPGSLSEKVFSRIAERLGGQEIDLLIK